jgi:hypothetical protein
VGESEHISHLLKQDTPEGQSPVSLTFPILI